MKIAEDRSSHVAKSLKGTSKEGRVTSRIHTGRCPYAPERDVQRDLWQSLYLRPILRVMGVRQPASEGIPLPILPVKD